MWPRPLLRVEDVKINNCRSRSRCRRLLLPPVIFTRILSSEDTLTSSVSFLQPQELASPL